MESLSIEVKGQMMIQRMVLAQNYAIYGYFYVELSMEKDMMISLVHLSQLLGIINWGNSY